MIPKPLRQFMVRLLEATNDGELRWHEGSEEAYYATHKNADLNLRYVFDGDTGDSGYTFRIVRGEGDAFFSVPNYEDDYGFMRNLFSAVSVNASGGANMVDGLFD